MVQLKELVSTCDELLAVDRFADYAPNGLQIEGKSEVNKIVTGVTANQALIDRAVAAKADALLVHHGFFWKGENACITGIKQKRISALLKNDISLIGYHLPLDAHSEIGNNVKLAEVLGISIEGRFGRGAKDELGAYGVLEHPMSCDELKAHIAAKLNREPLHLRGIGDEIKRIAWCSGAAQSYIESAYELGVDAFISGEVSENTTHFVRESGIHYFAAGHHATERYGVQALGEFLKKKFNIDHEFIDIDNPV